MKLSALATSSALLALALTTSGCIFASSTTGASASVVAPSASVEVAQPSVNVSSGSSVSTTTASTTTTAGPVVQAPPSWAGLVDPIVGNWNFAQRESWNLLNEELAGYVRDARAQCGVDLVASYDYESFRSRFQADERYGLNAYDRNCVSVVSVIRDICVQNAAGVAAVRANVRHLVCHFGPPGYSLVNGEGRMNISEDLSGSTVADQWSNYVRNHM